MKANFNIAKNVRNSRSISALSALRKLQSLGLLLCALLLGSSQVWGEEVTTSITTTTGTSWTVDGVTWTAANYVQGGGSYLSMKRNSSTITAGSTITMDLSGSNTVTVTVHARYYGGKKAYVTAKLTNASGTVISNVGSVQPTSNGNKSYNITLTPTDRTVTEVKVVIGVSGADNDSKYIGLYSFDITYEGPASTSHDIFYNATGSGSVSGDASADEGDEVAITVSPNPGNYLSSLSVQTYDNDDVYIDDVEVGEGYTFTMPSSFTGYVWVEAVFSAIPSYSVTYNVPACVTSPSGTLTSQSTFAMPTPGVPGYKFEGWVSSAVSTPTSTKPSTIYKPGDYLPSNNQTYYALYCAVSDGFTLKTSNPTSGNYYMLTGSSNAANSKASKNETTTQSRIAYEDIVTTGNVITNTDWALIWKFIKDGDYWYVYNENAGKYLAASGTGATSSSDYKCTLSTTKNDNSAWTVSVSAAGVLTLTNKARNSASDTNKLYRIGAAGYGGFYSSGNLYIFEQNSVAASYTTNPTCPTTDHTITFNANGGSGSMSPITDIEDGTSATLTSNTFSKDGYSFGGWTADVTVTIGGSPVSPGSTIANGATLQNITSDINLTAIWTPNPYNLAVSSVGHATITATPAGGSAIAEGSNANVDCGKTVTLNYSSVDPNYTFTNWVILKASDDSDVSGSVSLSSTTANNATFVMPAYGVKVSAVITAPYIYFTSCSADLTVTYDANGGTGNVPVDGNTYSKDGSVTVLGNVGTPSVLSREGYTFGGWQAGGVGTVYSAGDSYTITSNTTFFAVWTPNNYKITSISTNPASSGTVTATYNDAPVVAGTTDIPCGSTVTLSQTPIRGKNFTGWTVTKAGGGTVTVTSNQFTMPASNVTVVANYESLSSCTITFNVPGGTIGTTTLSTGETSTSTTVTLYSNESISSLPSLTPNCGDWNTFVGWIAYNATYDVAAGVTTAPVGAMTAGTAYANPGAATTLYAVYRKTDGSDDFDGTNSGTYYVKGTSSSTAYYAAACLGALSSEITTTSSTTGGATPFVFTKNGDYYNISCSEGNYVQTSGTTTTASSDAALWTATQVGSLGASGTGYWEFVNKGSNTKAIAFDALYSQLKFNFNSSKSNLEDGTNTRYVPLELVSASTYYYSINPVCTSYTVTKGTCTPASSVLDASSHACDFKLNNTNNNSVTTSSGGSVTIYLYPNDDYTDDGATVSVDVPGNVTTINAINTETHTCLITGITGNITVSVSYVARPKYTVHLYDQGVKQSDVTQTHYGENVTLPTGNNCGVGSTYTFVGWTDYANTLAADPVKPNIVVAAASLSSWAPTAETTLYAVYSKSYETCDNFAAGVSGSYIISQGTKYVLNTGTNVRYDVSTDNTNAEKFIIAYSALKDKYTIRTSTGYIVYDASEGEIKKGSSVPYYWNIASSGGGWKITPPGVASKWLTVSTYFKIMGSDYTALTFTKATTTYYYSIAVCSDSHAITFHNVDGATINAPASTPVGSWDGTNKKITGLADCNKVTVWPTATYAGWAFVGWSTEDFSNSGNHTADYVEENGSTDEPYTDIVYGNGANSYTVLGGNVDMYPVFTRLENNEPMDLGDGGEFYVYFYRDDAKYQDAYYGADGHFTKVYAKAGLSNQGFDHTLTCSNAQLFNFIPDAVTGKWDIKIGDQWLTNASNNDLALSPSQPAYQWTITKDGARYLISYDGNSYNTPSITRLLKAFESGGSTWRFKCYGTDQLESSFYYTIYVGTCEERIFSSEPNPTPIIDLTGEPIVTSSLGQEVRATATMTLTAAHLTSVPATRVKITGTNLRFATTATATPAANCYVDLVSGNANATLYVYYQPTATEDGTENIVVTAQAYNGNTSKDVTTTGVVHGRHLPADFVIAAKREGKWYALPNTCTSYGSSTAGVFIEVDDDDAPTAATSAPNTTKWGLRNTKAGSRVDGSYKDRLVFTERGTTETANNQQALYNYNSADIYTNATYTNYNNTNPERYEWIPVTSDFGDYELTNANDATRHLILRNSDGTFVAQNTDKAYDGKVRLLPATFYEEAPVQILEWKANSVVVMYTGTETSATTEVGTNIATSAQTLSTRKLTHGIYELTTTQSLASNDGKTLLLSFGASTKKAFEIPVIITGTSTAATGHDKQDVVIVKNAKLTAAATKYSYRNVYVYGGGKLDIPSGTSLGVNNIILRAGGITTSGIGSSPTATYEYIYPQVKLVGTLTSTQTNIKYEYITDYDHWYHMVLPFNGTWTSITYPIEYYGTNVAEGNHGSWIIKRYDGATRAKGNYNAWVDIETDGEPKTVYKGHGYIYWGAPKKLTIGGATDRSAWGIQRITMYISADGAIADENADKMVSGLGSWSAVEGNSGKPNDQGWNLIGNPFMANLTDMSTTGLHACKLVKEEDAGGNWTGHWEWNTETSIRYLTIPDHTFDSYEAKTVSTAVGAGDLNTGHVFFIQLEGAATAVTFNSADRATLMPALYAKTTEAVDVETGIVLSSENQKDEVNFWIKDGKTDEYEYNADYPKTMNQTNFNIYGVHSHGELSWVAISPEIAGGSMAIGYQVPAAGDYMLSLSETYVSNDLKHVFVTDHGVSPEITTDLMEEAYIFHVDQAETNDERFTVSFKLKELNQEQGIEDVRSTDGTPQKFLYRDKIYILRNGVLYDATGKQVQINK